MKIALPLICFIAILVSSCGSSTPEFDNSLPPLPPGVITVQSDSLSPATAPASAGNVALNPPHGQPGHDCNVAVGAPLNSVSAATGAALPPTMGVSNATAPVRLNPPHGQPGHDCNVQVGQPLP